MGEFLLVPAYPGSPGSAAVKRLCVCLFAVALKSRVHGTLQADQVDADMLELVTLEMNELLAEFGFDAQETPIVCGSALCALEDRDPEVGEKSIRKLLSAIDDHIVPPSRDLDGPFVLPVEKAFTIAGRGTVAVGTLQRGVINKGDMAELVGYGNRIKTAASDVQVCSWEAFTYFPFAKPPS